MTRADLIDGLKEAGRRLSDETVLFHAALSARLGLGVTDWKALSLLQAQGPMTAGDLARLTGLTPPSVTVMLRRLQDKGWVWRKADAADARRVVVAIEADAAARLGDAFGGLLRRTTALYTSMTDDDLAQALTLLVALTEATESARQDLTTGSSHAADDHRGSDLGR